MPYCSHPKIPPHIKQVESHATVCVRSSNPGQQGGLSIAPCPLTYPGQPINAMTNAYPRSLKREVKLLSVLWDSYEK